MFIVFEGPDGCGKSTLSKEFAKEYRYKWTKEPTFTSEEADRLNLGSMDDIGREIEFCIDRVKHQEYIIALLEEGVIVVCDRYIWSGLAYSKIFNPSAYGFAKAMYKHQFFLKPDYYVYVDTPINICSERKRDQTKEQLILLEKAYGETKKFVMTDSKIIRAEGIGNIHESVLDIHEQMKLFRGGEK